MSIFLCRLTADSPLLFAWAHPQWFFHFGWDAQTTEALKQFSRNMFSFPRCLRNIWRNDAQSFPLPRRCEDTKGSRFKLDTLRLASSWHFFPTKLLAGKKKQAQRLSFWNCLFSVSPFHKLIIHFVPFKYFFIVLARRSSIQPFSIDHYWPAVGR